MAQYKNCPQCGAEVPASASRCKTCFHDFKAIRRRNWGPLILLGAFASMTLIGTVTFAVIAMRPVDERILVDQETKSVIFTTKYRTGPTTERVPWTDIDKIEHVSMADGHFEIVAVTRDGDKVIAQSDKEPLFGTAQNYATMMNKPLEKIDQTAVSDVLKKP